MAPPNPGYNENIQELKTMILSKASELKGVTLSEFNNNICNLWGALLNEDLVFSFKNSEEPSRYKQLEEVLTKEEELKKKIEKAKCEEIEYTDLALEMAKNREKVTFMMTD